MIIYEERNDEGRRAATDCYADFCSTTPELTSIDRVSFLYGMQAFCCGQLKTELRSAVEALEGTLPPRIRPPRRERKTTQ